MKFNQIGAVIGTVTGVLAVTAAAWGTADYLEVRPVTKHELRLVMDVQQQTVETLALFHFQWLQAKRNELLKLGAPVSIEDMQEYCSLAKQVFPDVTLDECK